MKKISLVMLGFYCSILSAFSQGNTNADSVYKSRKLKFEEANFVSSYYQQNGDHAAVTGGIGSEKLDDISNSFDIKFYKYDKHNRKHSLLGEIGIDHYTSASSDKIDPTTISSASHADTRIYPSLNWTMENEKKGSLIGAGLYASSEFDYKSFGGNINFSKKTNDRNGEFSAKLQTYLDQVTLVYPIEFRPANNGRKDQYATTPRHTFSGTLAWSQVINKNLQLSLEGEVVYQKGYLGLPFHRVYFNDQSVHIENLPTTRLKIPLGIRANYFLGDNLIIRGWYRYYKDDWKIQSNTAQIETTVKLNPFFSITPFYRFYHQTAADYFAGYGLHTVDENFFTSNYDLSDFTSNFYGIGFRIAPPNGVFHAQHINALEIRFGHYRKTTGMNANILSMNLKFR